MKLLEIDNTNSQINEICEIKSNRDEVKDSASIDLEWIPYKGKYQHNKTKIYAAAFCTNWGDRIILHISNYDKSKFSNPERAMLIDFLSLFNQFPLTFGWYTTGIAIYDEITGKRMKGRDSDFFILHQRCLFYNLDSPFEISHNKTYVSLIKSSNNKHIDLIKVFEKPIIKDNVFEGKYRTIGLDAVSTTLLGKRKYQNIDTGNVDILERPLVTQKEYVKRDAELVMMLALYNNCLVLRLMKLFSVYSELDYFQVCHTNVSKWYEQKYKKMLERGEGTIDFTPEYRIKKENIAGGHHTAPQKGFFVESPVYELDVKGMYPTIVLNKNLSFDTLNCTCCKYDNSSYLDTETIETINQGLLENKINRSVTTYWVCKRRKGLFPLILTEVLSTRDKNLGLLKKELSKSKPNPIMIEEFKTHQIACKLFANAGFGLFGNEYFEYSNYRVAECITGEGRRIHQKMETMAKDQPFGFDIVFGFTDSIFFSVKECGNGSTPSAVDKIQEFIAKCKKDLGIVVEVKSTFQSSMFYGKKNRFVGWTGNEYDALVVKGLDGLAESNPQWVRKWFLRTINELIKNPEIPLENIPKILKEAFLELEHIICKSQKGIEQELKFTQKLKKNPNEYVENVRTGKIGRMLEKDKGDEIYWYETIDKDTYTKENYSLTAPDSENINILKYKQLLICKLKDTLEIAGINYKQIELALLQKIFPMDFYLHNAKMNI